MLENIHEMQMLYFSRKMNTNLHNEYQQEDFYYYKDGVMAYRMTNDVKQHRYRVPHFLDAFEERFHMLVVEGKKRHLKKHSTVS